MRSWNRLARVMLLSLAPCLVTAQQTSGGFQRAGSPPTRPTHWQPRYDYIDVNQLSISAEWLARYPRSVGGSTLHTSLDAQTTYLLVRRRISSEPEVHARWDDIVMVRSGRGVIVMGDSLIESRYRAPGERAGGRMNRSFQLVVHAGDIVRIPAAVPHMFIVHGAEPLEYLVIKQRRQQLPIRWYEP
jgi:mannose-6-phosphate isomerase-like protein (cupin superfamily)